MILIVHTRGTTRTAAASPATFSGPSASRSRPSDATLKLISSSTARCGEPCFGGSRTASSSRWGGCRSWYTPYSMARGIGKAGDADETHNRPLERTGYAGRSTPFRSPHLRDSPRGRASLLESPAGG